MSTQIFLHLEIQGGQIHGEATTGGYEGEIELESFRWGLSAKHSPKQDNRTLKPVLDYDELTITKLYDKSSINFARYLNSRAPFDVAQLIVDHHVHAAGSKKDQNPALIIDLSEGRIVSVKITISESDKGSNIKEDITLTFRKVDVLYYPTADRTKRAAPVMFTGPQLAKR